MYRNINNRNVPAWASTFNLDNQGGMQANNTNTFAPGNRDVGFGNGMSVRPQVMPAQYQNTNLNQNRQQFNPRAPKSPWYSSNPLLDMYGAAPQNNNLQPKLDKYTTGFNNYWAQNGGMAAQENASPGERFNLTPDERAGKWQNNFSNEYYKYMSDAYRDGGLNSRFAEGGRDYDPRFGKTGADYMQSIPQAQNGLNTRGLLGY